MIELAILLAATQSFEADCGRYRNDDLQPCEFRRDESADIFEAAGRPTARGLGAETIRYSRRPSLGGRGLIVEIVNEGRGGAQVRVFTLWGHPQDSWRLEHSRRLTLSREGYRRLAAAVDTAIANRVLPPDDAEEQIVCMDGPSAVTERVSNGVVLSLTGFCPPTPRAHHPNQVVAAAVQDMLCRGHDPAARPAYWSGRHCYTRLRTMAEATGYE